MEQYFSVKIDISWDITTCLFALMFGSTPSYIIIIIIITINIIIWYTKKEISHWC